MAGLGYPRPMPQLRPRSVRSKLVRHGVNLLLEDAGSR